MASETSRKVLMLHGFAQSGVIFSKRVAAMRKACKGIGFVFVDAPHVLWPTDIAHTSSTPDELGASEATDADPSLAPRGWWINNEQTKMFGVEDSLIMLRDVLRKDRYAGVFGFSQGAGMAALLAALLERPESYPPFLVDGQPPHPPLSFCVSVSGFKPRGDLAERIISTSYDTHTLHVIGKNDVVVEEERSNTLLAVSTNKRVEYHDGGHFVPSKASWRAFWRDYLLDPGFDVLSPGSQSGSTPASGTATPAG